jgi:MoxR-like ATPase
MEEREVTVEGQTYPTPRPFMVLATQNPIELEGTFPLPEAQLDRFMLRIAIGYPSEEEEEQIILSQGSGHPIERLGAVIPPEAILSLRERVAAIHVAPDVRRYITGIVRATREQDEIELGVSPRGSLALYRGAQAFSLLRGRGFVTPDDVKHLAQPILAHRLILNADARLRGRTSEDVIDEVASGIPVPVEAV